MSELPFIGTEEAAEALGVHPETVRRFCREGSLHAQHIGAYWAISRENVERLRKRRQELEQELQEKAPRRQERRTRSIKHFNTEPTLTHTTCVRCGEVLETTDDMTRWKYDGREWRHKCAKWQIVWRREVNDALD